MDDLNLEDIRKMINTYLGGVFKIGLILVILSTFFLYINLFSEPFETPRLLALLIFTGLLLIFISLKFAITGQVKFVRTPLDIPLLLLLAVSIVSTTLSASPYVALLGNQLKLHGSLVSIVVYVLFYFVLVNNLKNAREIKWIFILTILASQILGVSTLLNYAGIKLFPIPTNFYFSATAVLALLAPFLAVQILTSKKPLIIIINAIFLTISGITIALTGTWATWIAALFGLALTFFASELGNLSFLSNLRNLKNLNRLKLFNLVGLMVPLVLIALTTILSFIPPIGNAKNPIYTRAQNFPREIQLPFVTSWKIAVSSFRDFPFWGTGPATYLFNFTNYKPIEFNSSKTWNLKFDSSFNEYLQVLSTLGGVGLVALLSLTALFISSAYKVLSTVYRLPSTAEVFPSGGPRKTEDDLRLALAISGLVFFIILALHTSTLALWVIGLLILASFMVTNLSETLQKSRGEENFKETFLRISGLSTVNSSTETIKIDALPGILLTAAVAIVLVSGFFGGKFALADYHHKLALNAVSGNQGIIAYNEFISAEKLNPYNDVYRTNLAQTNFALANAIASAKAPTEASPTGSLTDQDKQNIQVLLQQSIEEGKTATVISPRSSINWEILGLLYRQIAGVAQNALVFSLDAYGRAIFQDPLNPNLRLNVGGIYYVAQNYDTAIRFFTDAINLKPDFANGYYNLSVAFRDKGDLGSAVNLAEKTLTLVDKDSADYQVVNNLLSELKKAEDNKQSFSTNKTVTSTSVNEPPAAKTSGSLQEKELPKVVNIGNPPKNIATPSAVPKPSPTP